MKKLYVFFIVIFLLTSCDSPLPSNDNRFVTHFEKTNGKEPTPYTEMVSSYKDLAERYNSISLKTIGQSESGNPLYIAIYNADGSFDLNEIRAKKNILLIAGGLEETQQEGMEATMLLMRNLAKGQISELKNTAVVVILAMNEIEKNTKEIPSNSLFFPKNTYNIDSDLLKTDGKTAKTFSEIFHLVQPTIFVDIRTFSDENQNKMLYQTIIPERMGRLKNYLNDVFLPRIADSLPVSEANFIPFRKFEISENEPVGYAWLWQTLSLKITCYSNQSYKAKTENIYNVLKNIISVCEDDKLIINKLQEQSEVELLNNNQYPLVFKALYPVYKNDSISLVENQPKFISETKISVPKAYVIPQWLEELVVNRLKTNRVEVKQFEKDTLLQLSTYKIQSYKTSEIPVEGHYKHFETKTLSFPRKIFIKKGDFLVETRQKSKAYLLETLEPSAENSFFNWNFFDIILSKKDTISDYYPVFRLEK